MRYYSSYLRHHGETIRAFQNQSRARLGGGIGRGAEAAR